MSQRTMKVFAKRQARVIDKMCEQLTDLDMWDDLDEHSETMVHTTQLIMAAKDILEVVSDQLSSIAGVKQGG
jgi:hypothetical protein